MANLSLIRDLCDEKKITLKQLAEAVSISQNGLQRIIKDNSTKIETLEKIAKYLEVSVTDFFVKGKEELVLLGDLKKRNELLENKMRDLNKLVESLSEQLEDKRMILDILKSSGAISGYNLATPKEKRGIDYNIDLNDPDSILKSLDEQPFDYKDEEAKWEYLEKLAKAKRIKKK